MEIPANEPLQFRAGDSVAWTRELSEYPAADGWQLKYRLLYASGSAVNISAAGSGTTHSVSLSAADTAAYTAGTATLVAYVEKGAGPTLERVTLESTQISILPNLVTARTFDGRSAAAIALANLRAALNSMASNQSLTVASVSLEGRSTTFRSIAELQDAINHYERQVFKETAALALMNGISAARVVVRM